MPLAFFQDGARLSQSFNDLFIYLSTSKSPLYVGIQENKNATKFISKISTGFFLI